MDILLTVPAELKAFEFRFYVSGWAESMKSIEKNVVLGLVRRLVLSGSTAAGWRGDWVRNEACVARTA